jgi:hypothetical protein
MHSAIASTALTRSRLDVGGSTATGEWTRDVRTRRSSIGSRLAEACTQGGDASIVRFGRDMVIPRIVGSVPFHTRKSAAL